MLLSQGKTAEEIAKALEVSKQTYYRWRKEYGGLNMTQVMTLPFSVFLIEGSILQNLDFGAPLTKQAKSKRSY